MKTYAELEAVLREVTTFFEHPLDAASPIQPARSWSPAPGLADRLEQLADKIRSFEMRREFERHAHDVAPGQDSMTPMLNLDLHRS